MIKEKIKDKFRYGDVVYKYYRYLDRFHCEPKSWLDILEFSNYVYTDSAVNKLIADTMRQEK